jgi:acyl-Coa thioesterase superfamily protein/acyl-CoA thioesterase superfamily protein
MAESIFLSEGEHFVPTEQARGPWDPRALHGGALAALIATAFERHEPVSGMQVARMGFELLRPIPFAPLAVEVQTVRPGRRVQELAAELYADGGEHGRQLICRASALRLQEIGTDLPALPDGTSATATMPGPQDGRPVRFSLNPDVEETSFAASAMEMRWLDDPKQLGPGRVWMRLRHPLVDQQQPSPLARLAATADFANGISASLPFEQFLFINADLHVHLHRPPRGDWIGIDARTLLAPGGTGLSESVLHDLEGPVGRAFQALVVSAR